MTIIIENLDGLPNGTDIGTVGSFVRNSGTVGSVIVNSDGKMDIISTAVNSKISYPTGQLDNRFSCTYAQSSITGNYYPVGVSVAANGDGLYARIVSGNNIELAKIVSDAITTLVGPSGTITNTTIPTGARATGDVLEIKRITDNVIVKFNGTEKINVSVTGQGVSRSNNVGMYIRSTTGADLITSYEIEGISLYAITSINSGAGITPGGTGNTATHTGFSGVPTAMTFGGKAATNIAGNATSSTFDFPYYVDLETYPQPGTSPNFIATLGAETATLAAPLNYPAGMTGVTVASPDTTNDKKLGYWIIQAGRTITNDDMLVYTTADVTGSPDSGFTAAAPLTTVIWHWIQSTGVMYQYNVTITEAGIATSTGLTVRGLSVSGLGVRGLTVRGLGGAAAMVGGFPYLLPFLLS